MLQSPTVPNYTTQQQLATNSNGPATYGGSTSDLHSGVGMSFEGGAETSSTANSDKPANDKYEEAILAGDIVYTKNYGWVDMNHAFEPSTRANVGADNLWRQLQNQTGETKDGYFKVTSMQDASVAGMLPGVIGEYWVKIGLSGSDMIDVAVHILKEVSLAFEALQGMAFWSGSSFEPADLPSNMLGLYRAIFPTMTQAYIELLIEPLTPAQSLEVYRQYPGTFTSSEYKNHSFSPKFFENKFSPDFPMVPIELTRLLFNAIIPNENLIRINLKPKY